MKKSTFFADFKAFIAKGNILDMAVGVIIGGAFGKIVTSLVNDIIMPSIGLLTGSYSVADWKWVMQEAVLNEAGEIVKKENALMYGNFIQTIVDFLIVALCIFTVLRVIVKMKKRFESKEDVVEEKKEELPPKETTEDILKDIRELLKK